VPKSGSFEDLLKVRARAAAAKIIGHVDHTMRLEAQNLEAGALAEEIESLAAQMVRENHKLIWEDQK